MNKKTIEISAELYNYLTICNTAPEDGIKNLIKAVLCIQQHTVGFNPHDELITLAKADPTFKHLVDALL